jgi:hypothetical protein
MPRRILILVVVAGVAAAAPAVLPPRMGDFNRTATPSYAPADAALFREYGLDTAERAQYVAGDRKLEITLLRAKDATGAFGMYQWLRPADAKPAQQIERSVEKGDALLFQYGNYVLELRGARPEQEHLEALLSILPRFERTVAPPVFKYLPSEGRVANSERFIQGPVALQMLAPTVPPSTAAFHMGAEGEVAEYGAEGGKLKLLLFTYPTPQMARAQIEEFHRIAGIVTKRSGPIVAVILNPFSRDEAEKLLARVRYDATLTWNQPPQMRNENIGEFLVGVVMLCLILVGFAILAGVGLGGVRILLGKWFPQSRFNADAQPAITRLKLDDPRDGPVV